VALLGVAAVLLLVGLRVPVATVAAVVLLIVATLDGLGVLLEPRLRVVRRNPRLRVAQACLPVVALIGSTWLYIRPLCTPDLGLLLDQDNAVHVERARLFVRALREGHLPLWTHLSQGGEPLVDFYGWLGNFLPALVRVVSLGRLDFDRAYEVGVASVFTLTSLAAWSLARRFARRSIAFAVALLPAIGGHYATQQPLTPFWSWHLLWGVWPALLALNLAVFSTARAIDVARRGRTADVLAAVALATAACLTHAFGLLVLGLLQGALAIAVVLHPRMRSRLPSFVVAIVCGPLLAAFFWIPSGAALSVWGLRFATRLAEGTASFDVLVGQLTVFGVTAAAFASVLAVLRGDVLLRAIAAAGLAGVLIDASPFLTELGLLRTEAGRTIQWARLAFVFLFTASAALAFVIEVVARRASKPRSVAFESIAARSVVAFVVVLLLGPTLGRVVRDGRERLLAGRPDRTLQERESFEALGRALADRRQREPSPFRVHFVPKMDAEHTLSLAVASGVPVLHTEYAGPIFLKNRMQNPSADEERAWGARYAVVERGTSRPPPWVLDERIGVFDLLKDPENPGIVRPPPGVRVEVLAFRDDEVRLRITGARPEGADLRLAIGWYPRFRATEDGRVLPIAEIPAVPNGNAKQMAIHVTNGDVVLRPTRLLPGTTLGRVGTGLGFALLLAFLVVRVFPERVRRLGEKAAPLGARALRARAWVGDRAPRAVLVFFAVVVLVRIASKPAAPKTLEVTSLYGDRQAVQRTDRPTGTTTSCTRSVLTRDWSCSSTSPKAVGRIATIVSASAFEGVSTPTWVIGAPWPGLRIEEREGDAELDISLAGSCQKFLHPRVSGGIPVSPVLTIGKTNYPIAWTSVSTIDLRNAPEGPATLHLAFPAPTSIALAFDCDDNPEPPKLDDRTP